MADPTGIDIAFRPWSDRSATLGESPVWDDRTNRLWWVDIEGARLMRSHGETGETESWTTPELAGFVVLTESGAPAVGMESGIFLFNEPTARFERLLSVEDPGLRFNDAAVDASGRLWAGSMTVDNSAPSGKLYAIGADLRPRLAIEELWTVNGLAIDPERGRLYVADAHVSRQAVWHAPLDLETGEMGERTLFADFRERAGRPDGAALDATGHYLIAGVAGGGVHVFAPSGAHLVELETPFENPTKPCFGGASLDRLYLTSKGRTTPNGAVAIGQGNLGPLRGGAANRWRLGR